MNKNFYERERERVKRNLGFTLIELLVVISIIGFLATASMVVFNSVRQKARDTRRASDIKQIQLAIEMYYDKYGYYPNIAHWATSEPTSYDSGAGWASLQTALSEFIAKLPNDPLPTGSGGPWSDGNYHYVYGVGGGGQIYDLLGQFEQTSNSNNCQSKCWKYHAGEGPYLPETSWCGVRVPSCGGNGPWSPYIFADH